MKPAPGLIRNRRSASRLTEGLSSTDGDVPEIARMARLFSGLSSKDGDVPEIARMARLFSGLCQSWPIIRVFLLRTFGRPQLPGAKEMSAPVLDDKVLFSSMTIFILNNTSGGKMKPLGFVFSRS
jgi:hypothetical protein